MNKMKKTLLISAFVMLLPLIGAAQDEASLEQLRQAATEGNAEAQLEIGILYEFGYNMPKNQVTALAWYLRAAENGNALAAKRRDQLQARLKPDEIDEAQKLSKELAAKKPETTPATAPTESKPPSSSP